MNVDEYGFVIFDEDYDNPEIKQEVKKVKPKEQKETVPKETPKEKKLESLF